MRDWWNSRTGAEQGLVLGGVIVFVVWLYLVIHLVISVSKY